MAVKVEIFTRSMDVTESFREYLTKKASKLDRYLNDIDEVKVDLAYVKSARSIADRQVAQVTVHGRRALLRTEERADDIQNAFDAALEKMQRQLAHYKGKHHRGRGDGRSAAEVVEPLPEEITNKITSVIARRKTFNIIPMNEFEALEQMKLLGHNNFFIFYNINTDSINVLYRRRDDTYGLIEPRIG